MALFDREAKGVLGILDMHLKADNSATIATFKWGLVPFKKPLIDSAIAVKMIEARQMRFKHLKSCFVSSVYQKSAAAIRQLLTAVA